MAAVIENTIMLVLLAGLVYYGIPGLIKVMLRRRFLARVRRSGCTCLTFDDGPNPLVTPQIARELHQAGVRATFFLIGDRARRHPEITALLTSLGHEIGEHSYAHKNAWKSGPWASIRDLWRGNRALAGLCNGNPPLSLRPPFGKLNLVTLLYAWLKRRHLIFWDVDPRDYAQTNPDEVARHVLARLARGRVILLHDGRMRQEVDPAVTLVALRLILNHLAQSGLRFATVSEALALGTNGEHE